MRKISYKHRQKERRISYKQRQQDVSEVRHDTGDLAFVTWSSSSHSQLEKPGSPFNSVPAFSTLVDAQFSPTDTHIMESSRFTVLGDVDEVEVFKLIQLD